MYSIFELTYFNSIMLSTNFSAVGSFSAIRMVLLFFTSLSNINITWLMLVVPSPLTGLSKI